MGENIQSISQGTYTIGQTSATNFVAGPGIKIDEPSAGIVRIGNDETVLWSGSAYTGTFSENISAFEKIQFHMKDDTHIVGVGTLYTNDILTDGNYIVGCAATVWQPNSSPVRILSVSGNLTGFNSNNVSYQWWSKNDGGFASFNVTKVVGINRISGGNE